MEFKKKPAILVTTHGPLCEGLLGTMEMIYGELEDVTALSLAQGVAVADYEKQVADFLDAHDGDVVILLDFIGGSPFNTAMKLSRDREICALAGVNFGMLMAAMDLRSDYTDAAKLAAEIEKAAAETLKDVTPMLWDMHEAAKNMQ